MYIIKYIDNKRMLCESSNGYYGKHWVDSDGKVYDIDVCVQAVNEAKNAAMEDSPALGEILGSVSISPVNDIDIDTFATDGKSIVYSPKFVYYLLDVGGGGPFYIEYVLLHEALHILLNHCESSKSQRLNYPDGNLCNVATDYEVNYTLENYVRSILSDGEDYLPFKGVTNDDSINGYYSDDYAKMTWEEIYKTLSPPNKKVEKQKTSDEWKRGFIDGYNEILEDLRNKKLIERYNV